MSAEEPKMKKQKFSNHHQYKQHNKKYLEAGQRGFLATCNFRERDCIRECYNILNQYANELYGELPTDVSTKDVLTITSKTEVEKDSDDISDVLLKEITATRQKNKRTPPRFQQTDTGVTNCLFIQTTLSDPVELGLAIVKDIVNTKQQKTRHLLRLLPIEVVCHANLTDILKAAGELFDKYFLKTSTTYSIIFNKRYNNSIHRDDIIPELAELVRGKNVENKVDLKHAKKTIILEIVKGLCCISVVENYLQYKKYNLVELANLKKHPVTDNEPTIEANDVDQGTKSEIPHEV